MTNWLCACENNAERRPLDINITVNPRSRLFYKFNRNTTNDERAVDSTDNCLMVDALIYVSTSGYIRPGTLSRRPTI